MKVANGMVKLDSDFAKSIGFTSDRFGGYLWLTGKRIIISFIATLKPGAGDFSGLVKAIEAQGFAVDIPTPLAQMQAILVRWGWTPRVESDERFGQVELWSKKETHPQLPEDGP